MKRVITIKEYDSLTTKDVNGFVHIEESTFNQLEEFILSNRTKDTDALELMSLSSRKGLGKVITAKNYVGIITMNNGTTIEILPKIKDTNDLSNEDIRKIFLKMLKTLKNSPFKSIQKTNLDIHKLNVFEVFIKMFIDEAYMIVKKGLRSDYVVKEDNLNTFKGKVNFSKNIIYNIGHKERFYVQYDEFSQNRPENRLLKATLKYLYTKTNSLNNKNNINTLLNSFIDIEESTNYRDDFNKCSYDRKMNDYKQALLWCKVFLEGKSFTSFSGSHVAFALLFPMQEIFESYVASVIRKQLDFSKYSLSVQDKSYHLFDEPKKFLLQPDIVITRLEDNAVFIYDTKWKILDKSKNNYGISQADMYQMYAYHKKYDNAQSVTLIYPKVTNIDEDVSFIGDDGVTIEVKLFDLMEY